MGKVENRLAWSVLYFPGVPGLQVGVWPLEGSPEQPSSSGYSTSSGVGGRVSKAAESRDVPGAASFLLPNAQLHCVGGLQGFYCFLL